MKIIVGLGNPTKEYEETRHNVGFVLIDILADSLNLSWDMNPKFSALISKGSDFILVKPQTYMNNSGEAVSKILSYFKESVDNLIVIHDDLDLPIGEIRIQKGRGSAGHKGVENIFEMIKSLDFERIRIGIGRPLDGRDPADYVLQKFNEHEFKMIKSLDLASYINLR